MRDEAGDSHRSIQTSIATRIQMNGIPIVKNASAFDIGTKPTSVVFESMPKKQNGSLYNLTVCRLGGTSRGLSIRIIRVDRSKQVNIESTVGLIIWSQKATHCRIRRRFCIVSPWVPLWNGCFWSSKRQ